MVWPGVTGFGSPFDKTCKAQGVPTNTEDRVGAHTRKGWICMK